MVVNVLLLEIYIIINFKIYKINRNIYKLILIFILINNNNNNNVLTKK